MVLADGDDAANRLPGVCIPRRPSLDQVAYCVGGVQEDGDGLLCEVGPPLLEEEEDAEKLPLKNILQVDPDASNATEKGFFTWYEETREGGSRVSVTD